MLRKFHEAKVRGEHEVILWGSGQPMREFLHADDLADACVFLMDRYNEAGPINIGVGNDITINDLALLIKGITGFEGAIGWDRAKPDGTPRKLMDVSKLQALGWKASVGLEEGIRRVYEDFFSRG